jgi:arylsulfatase A-like enzyme
MQRKLALALLMGLTAGGCAAPAESPPNLIVVSIDTLARGALRVFDPTAAPAPHLDAFAVESVRFERALSTA